MSAAYYNEIDPFCAAWLRNLIAAGHIAAGDVDERSIEDVRPDDLRGYAQCHFFAGIGVWSSALRLAGWPDDRPVWTGSCPCQPFSAAGKGAGFDDERHLWPAWHWLISERRPPIVFGEQVASKDVGPWIDLVSTDMEGVGYAIGTVPFPSAGVGAPHIKDRTFFVADLPAIGHKKRNRLARDSIGWARSWPTPVRRSDIVGLADHNRDGCEPREQGFPTVGYGPAVESDCGVGWMEHASRVALPGIEWRRPMLGPSNASGASELADVSSPRRGERSPDAAGSRERGSAQGLEQRFGDVRFLDRVEPAGPTNGHWRDADWLLCRDGKWRPVEPGTFPLAHGATSRVGRLRAYGNAINREAARAFVESVMEAVEA